MKHTPVPHSLLPNLHFEEAVTVLMLILWRIIPKLITNGRKHCQNSSG